MNQMKLERELKNALKAAKDNPFVTEIKEKKRFDIINNIKTAFKDELLIRKVMKKEVYMTSVYKMYGTITGGRIETSSRLDSIDPATSEYFVNAFNDFIQVFTGDPMYRAGVTLALCRKNKKNWEVSPTVMLMIDKNIVNSMEMLKAFNRLQDFQDTFEVATNFDIGMLTSCVPDTDGEEGDSVMKHGYTAYNFGPLAMSSITIDETTVCVHFCSFHDHEAMRLLNIPMGMDLNEYMTNEVLEFEKNNKIKAAPAPKALPDKGKKQPKPKANK